ncbi:metal ABC transporter ATP-binding protein [Anaerococcus hydrogenalis]|uniref:Zinc ABC transporter ATP-binding protein n=1 Tax=Anaerococcus hydrogenalis TaxID=33029 RepID=A0A2N6UHJ4_9FIRM|nr:ATP-binding cassette domain-containing protein [Anaerococcus hydrogenalis]MDK7695493.1 ATP-binding cassette domain-containing protein [Anaerococcus hydrogenalis]MDK7697277.1 ATP-binding cassette domain-containing protein [Anaerococcus hydrogenalis]MDK7708520.1 ATP-binding cassette domain-containing protein [Anaerococcus hydrogenalis]PMC81046.1 zinc ABC transporter ATP-binding protein [Anaerococcus hydrogenalis]
MSNYALEIENLYFSYEDENILEDLSMKIEEGKFALIIGENGAGKTTLIRLILNQLKKDSGSIKIFSDPIEKSNHYQDLAYISQASVASFKLFPTNVKEVIENHLKFLKKSYDIDKLLEDFDLIKQKNHALSDLSGGQIQRLSLILAIIKDPKILILDEPTAAIDMKFSKDFYEHLKNLSKKGKTILMISHDYKLASIFSDEIFHLSDKKIRKIDRARLREGLGDFYV